MWATNKSDLFFYEELAKALGDHAAYEWLRSVSHCRNTLGPWSSITSCSPNLSPLASKRTTPQNSAPSTPRRSSLNQQSTLIVPSMSGINENSACRIETKREEGDRHFEVQQKVRASNTTTYSPRFSKIGLLYTDAAHSVINDAEVAPFVSDSGHVLEAGT